MKDARAAGLWRPVSTGVILPGRQSTLVFCAPTVDGAALLSANSLRYSTTRENSLRRSTFLNTSFHLRMCLELIASPQYFFPSFSIDHGSECSR